MLLESQAGSVQLCAGCSPLQAGFSPEIQGLTYGMSRPLQPPPPLHLMDLPGPAISCIIQQLDAKDMLELFKARGSALHAAACAGSYPALCWYCRCRAAHCTCC